MTEAPALLELALLCRVGFESDLIDELAAWCKDHGVSASIESSQPAVVRVHAASACPDLMDLVFARDLMLVGDELADLGTKDRAGPISASLKRLGEFSSLTVLSPDSEPTKPLAPLTGALQARLNDLCQARGSVHAQVWMLAGTHALVGQSALPGGPAHPGGIPRLRFPREAPSRSTLKLDEAFQVLMGESERNALLRAGGSAVDLGAAPGGWTYQMVQRQIRVTAIDNARMDSALIDSGLVQHLREDGFRYRPPRPVDWLICDMVEKPGKVAELIARWFRSGWCRAAVFNLKLPMKRRFAAWTSARELLQPLEALGFTLRARQLYHDREELTVAILPGSHCKIVPMGDRGGARCPERAPKSKTLAMNSPSATVARHRQAASRSAPTPVKSRRGPNKLSGTAAKAPSGRRAPAAPGKGARPGSRGTRSPKR